MSETNAEPQRRLEIIEDHRTYQLSGPVYPIREPGGNWWGILYYREESEEVARRFNAHAALVAALRMCREELVQLRRYVAERDILGYAVRDADRKIAEVDAALKLAETP